MALLSNDQSLNIVIKARNEASKVLSTVQKDMQTFKGKVESMQPAFQKMAIAGGAAFAGIGYGMKKALDEAVTLGESVNAVNVVFGDGADKILEFGKSASTSVGLANSELNQMATITGALLKDTGLSMDEVADQTLMLTKRAADMASVFNTDVDDAMSAINQAVRGETEAIRRYAGDVTDATLQTYLMSEGIDKQVSDLTEQEKRLYRVQLIMAQTAVTAGDFANTSDSLANQQRILAAQFKDISATLGAEMIPVVQSVLEKLRPVIEAVAKWIADNPKLAAGIAAAALALTGLVALVGVLGLILPPVIAGFALLASPVAAIIALLAVIGATIAYIALNWQEHWDNIKWAVGIAMDFITGKVAAFSTWWKTTWNGIKEAVSTVWTGITDVFKQGANTLIGYAEGIANFYVKAVNTIIGALNKIQVHIPSWVPGIGGKSFGINLPLVPEVQLPRFEHGGIVPGAVGQAVPIIAHGQERIIPANQAGRGEGHTFVVTINNPVVKSRDDIAVVREQMEQAFRDVVRGHKLTTI